MLLNRLFVFCFFIFSFSFFGQKNQKIDSLYNELSICNSIDDTLTISESIALEYFQIGNIDSSYSVNYNSAILSQNRSMYNESLEFYSQLIEVGFVLGKKDKKIFNKYYSLSKQQNNIKHRIKSSLFKAQVQEIFEADKLFNEALKISAENNNLLRGDIYATQGSFFLSNSFQKKAVENYCLSLSYFDRDLEKKLNITLNLANIYYNMRDYEKCREKINSAFLIGNKLEDVNNTTISYYYLGAKLLLAHCYLDESKYHLADSMYSLSIIDSKKLKHDRNLVLAYNSKSKIFSANYNFEKAIIYGDSAKLIAIKNHDNFQLIVANRTLAKGYLGLARYRDALDILMESYREIDNLVTNKIKFKYELSYSIYNFYQKLNNSDSALFYLSQHLYFKDSLDKIQNKENALTQEIKFNYKQLRLKDSIGYKNEIEVKDLEIQNEKRARNSMIIIIVGSSVFLVLGLYIYYNSRKNKLTKTSMLLEQKMLRAQLNPHFLSNGLSAIQSFILENNKLKASEYLAKFSKLTRLILESSREEYILLEDELELIKLYIQLQQARFNSKFDYSISVDDTVDLETAKIPSMILQPLVENAIEHGLSKIDVGELKLKVQKKSANNTEIEIINNGEPIKKVNTQGKKSYSVDIIKERVQLLNTKRRNKIVFEIKGFQNQFNLAAGTVASISIPN